ncbi:MAG: hypothetical protein ACTHU0_00530 [Kofleriaceae bacterium]
MQKTLAAILVLATAGLAHAGGQEGSIGVGAEFQLNGLGGASVNYDAGAFHVGGFLAFEDGGGDNDTDFGLGGRFYYHVHGNATADFSVGGSVGYLNLANPLPGDAENRNSALFLEPGIQVRAFLATNVALSFTAGLSIGLIDAEGASISGQPTGTAGFHYYFF